MSFEDAVGGKAKARESGLSLINDQVVRGARHWPHKSSARLACASRNDRLATRSAETQRSASATSSLNDPGGALSARSPLARGHPS